MSIQPLQLLLGFAVYFSVGFCAYYAWEWHDRRVGLGFLNNEGWWVKLFVASCWGLAWIFLAIAFVMIEGVILPIDRCLLRLKAQA